MTDQEKELIRLAEVEGEKLREAVHALADALEECESLTTTVRNFLSSSAKAVSDRQLLAMRKLNELRA